MPNIVNIYEYKCAKCNTIQESREELSDWTNVEIKIVSSDTVFLGEVCKDCFIDMIKGLAEYQDED